MSGIAAIVAWASPAVGDDSIRRMLTCVPHRSIDGSTVLSTSHCWMGFARFATTLRGQSEVQPLNDAQRGLSAVGDVRLDNRDELSEMLASGEQHLSDLELLVLGYRRWGADLAGHLVGDFAFVLWDEAHQTLYAARDPLGCRPLYYHSRPARFILATEVEQILASGEMERKVGDGVIVDYLADHYRHYRETFFREVFRIVPGHYLLAKNGSHREVRYWHPPSRELRLGRAEEYYEEFRRLFELSVAARLESDRPVMATLSGGIDSSSIVCMADAIYGRNGSSRPPLYAASALFPGLACDETPFIDAVARKVRFPSERWDARSPDLADIERPLIADPCCDESGLLVGLSQLASAHGARVLLSGEGGDQLLSEFGVFRDLAASNRWLRLLREAWLAPRYSFRSTRYWLRDAVLYTHPRLLRSYYWLQSVYSEPPPWLAKRLCELWPRLPWVPQTATNGGTSHTQQCTWRFLTSEVEYWQLEREELWAAHHGLYLRFPFLDAPLARFVLAVPFEHRLPGGEMKILARRALEGLLPGEITHRQRVTTFTSNSLLQARRNLPRLKSIICGGAKWLSEPYVDRREAEKLVGELAAGQTIHRGRNLTEDVWNIATLELWLRHVNETQ